MKVGIYTLGCKVNSYESEYIISELKKNNYEIGSFDDICDIYIVNTCTVTNTSDIKSKKILRSARRKNKDAIIIAIGCYIEANKEEKIEDADIIIGNKDKSKIIDIIEEYKKNKEKIKRTYVEFDENFEDMFIEKYESKTRGFIKIQDGCENFCSYCIIPYVRGKCRSKDKDIVIKEINTLVKNGFKEIVLTGIHTGNYGKDISTSFHDLLKEIITIEGLKRLRISSIEITELNNEVLKLIEENDVIVNHLHIPIQSASNKVLNIMNRKYNLDYFIDKIKKIREVKKDISITTDIIVGHPGESDEEFNNSLEVIKKLEFSKIHVFPYSKRNKTKAATMEQIDDKVKKERARRMLELSKELEIKYMNRFINKEVEVLVETTKDNKSIGHTTNYLQVKLNKEHKPGEFVTTTIEKVEYPYCIGKI